MSEDAIMKVTVALKARLERILGGAEKVYVGAPNKADVDNRLAALFLFHINPNAELRNEVRMSPPPASGPAEGPAVRLNALPLDLRYLLTVFRRTGDGGSGDPTELKTLGQIIQVLHAEPTLADASVSGQVVRLTLDPYSMEEMSRIWGLFPGDSYRTSVVYLASPVFVEAGEFRSGPPVQKREQRSGIIDEAPNYSGRALQEDA